MSDDIPKVVAMLRSHPPALTAAMVETDRDGAQTKLMKMRAFVTTIADYLDQHARTVPEATGTEWLAWAREMFGEIAADPKERALRFVEEALELGQAMGIDAATIAKTTDRVYSRPAGSPAKEIAQSSATLDTLAHVMDVDPRAASTAEFTRVKTIPKEEWTRRHQAKVDAGFALTEPSPEVSEPSREELIEALTKIASLEIHGGAAANMAARVLRWEAAHPSPEPGEAP